MIKNSDGCLAGVIVLLATLLVQPASAEVAGNEQPAVNLEPEQQVGRETSLPIPRYVSLKARRANARRGPSTVYPIDWVFTRSGIPLEVIGEFENWRQIRAIDDAEGWVVSSFLTGRRTGLITADGTRIHLLANSTSLTVAKANRMVIVAVRSCSEDWCLIDLEDLKGWVHKDHLWGVYHHEVF
ncbi:MAG: SH3 domain-containing protein [Rhodobacteraceae bacterium]|nr:SH3 domain-containing protein [Paracoccaceae bacterium]